MYMDMFFELGFCVEDDNGGDASEAFTIFLVPDNNLRQPVSLYRPATDFESSFNR